MSWRTVPAHLPVHGFPSYMDTLQPEAPCHSETRLSMGLSLLL